MSDERRARRAHLLGPLGLSLAGLARLAAAREEVVVRVAALVVVLLVVVVVLVQEPLEAVLDHRHGLVVRRVVREGGHWARCCTGRFN